MPTVRPLQLLRLPLPLPNPFPLDSVANPEIGIAPVENVADWLNGWARDRSTCHRLLSFGKKMKRGTVVHTVHTNQKRKRNWQTWDEM